MASVNEFSAWKADLTKRMRDFSAPVNAPVKLEMTQSKMKGTLDLEGILNEFAIDFMGHFFVEEVLKPAFFRGEGIGGGGANAVTEHMPQIETGYSVHLGRNTGEKGADGKYRKVNETLDDLIKQQKADSKDGLTMNEDDHVYTGGIGDKASRRLDEQMSEQAEMFKELDLTGFAAQWTSGFKSLFASMSQVKASRSGAKGIRVDMGSGPAMLSHKLGSYSITRGPSSQSEYDSFFYAAEFGTGVAENVGGSQWVRTQKKNNAEERHGMRGEPGSWWFWGKKQDGTERGGGLFSGQKGLHFLFDEQTRQPRDLYRKWIDTNIFSYLNNHLSAATKGQIRASRRG